MKKSKGESKDRLSELPSSLILDILSLLPMKDVVRTTILSKRWKNLWTTIPCLNICDHDAERIRNFVNAALIFWKGNKIKKFDIAYKDHFNMSLAKNFDVWVCFAKENSVEELKINLRYEPSFLEWENTIAGSERDVYVAPQCLNSCSSIKKLSLVGCNLRVPVCPSWNQLQTLRIDGFCFSEESINRVLYGAPQLEVFTLRLLESQENVNIQSTSLKKLMIEKFVEFFYRSQDGDDDEQPSTNTALRIECPNLEVLEIAGFLYAKCVLTNVPSLTDVSLRFGGLDYYDYRGKSGKKLLGETLRQIFSTIQHVEKVTLSDWCVKVLGASKKKYLVSSLSNVKFLKLDVRSMQLEEMTHLFGIFPNLKKLDIEGHGFYGDEFIGLESNPPNSSLLQLRTIEIRILPFNDTAIYGFVEFLLKHASMLEKMVVWMNSFERLSKESFFKVAERLLSMPRSSKTAKVILRKS